jgi:hypothetical protein
MKNAHKLGSLGLAALLLGGIGGALADPQHGGSEPHGGG